MGLPARDTIIAHKLFLHISIGCVTRDSVVQVVLCIIIVPGLMIKEPPQFKTSLRACIQGLVYLETALEKFYYSFYSNILKYVASSYTLYRT